MDITLITTKKPINIQYDEQIIKNNTFCYLINGYGEIPDLSYDDYLHVYMDCDSLYTNGNFLSSIDLFDIDIICINSILLDDLTEEQIKLYKNVFKGKEFTPDELTFIKELFDKHNYFELDEIYDDYEEYLNKLCEKYYKDEMDLIDKLPIDYFLITSNIIIKEITEKSLCIIFDINLKNYIIFKEIIADYIDELEENEITLAYSTCFGNKNFELYEQYEIQTGDYTFYPGFSIDGFDGNCEDGWYKN